MVFDRVGREPDDLRIAPVEFALHLRHGAQLGRAHRREILGMREQHRPLVADPLVEIDLAFGGFGLEVRCRVANTQGHGNSFDGGKAGILSPGCPSARPGLSGISREA